MSSLLQYMLFPVITQCPSSGFPSTRRQCSPAHRTCSPFFLGDPSRRGVIMSTQIHSSIREAMTSCTSDYILRGGPIASPFRFALSLRTFRRAGHRMDRFPLFKVGSSQLLSPASILPPPFAYSSQASVDMSPTATSDLLPAGFSLTGGIPTKSQDLAA